MTMSDSVTAAISNELTSTLYIMLYNNDSISYITSHQTLTA